MMLKIIWYWLMAKNGIRQDVFDRFPRRRELVERIIQKQPFWRQDWHGYTKGMTWDFDSTPDPGRWMTLVKPDQPTPDGMVKIYHAVDWDNVYSYFFWDGNIQTAKTLSEKEQGVITDLLARICEVA